jgi:serine/threonine protein kinase
MGDVWRADDLMLETPVALKLIQGSGEESRLRILNEVRLARQITDPAVCRVFDVGEADGRVFFSMELVPGEDLAALLRRVGRLPSERVIEIAHQLCAGLAAAHAQGVLHRDLKPANVLIDEHGRIRITDFGIAVSRGDTQRHTLTGTPGYMAPEQLKPGASLSERTDIYALGLVLYELLVGQHPFNRAERTAELPRPSARVPDVDRRLERVIMQALAADPEERPASAVAMASSPITRSVAREIAQREQSKALLSGSISSLGRNYVLALEAVSAATGDVMAREQVEASSKEEVLTALGAAASRLREKLGESLASIEKFDVPLAKATTPSLEALHAYSLALDQGRPTRAFKRSPISSERSSSIRISHSRSRSWPRSTPTTDRRCSRQRSQRRHSSFATASASASATSSRFRYLRDATQNWEQALPLARSWTATYPREPFAFNSLGLALSRFGRFDESLQPFREAIRLDPRFVAPYSNLAISLIALDQHDAAKEVFKDAASKNIEGNTFRRLSYLLAFVENDAATMTRFVEASVRERSATAFGWEGHTAAFGGRLGAALDRFRRGIEMAMRRLLVDHGRHQKRQKRGGGAQNLGLDDLMQAATTGGIPVEDLLTLEAALTKLEAVDPRAAEVVTLRFFSGLSVPEVAEHKQLSVRTVEAEWTHARAWLKRELH